MWLAYMVCDTIFDVDNFFAATNLNWARQVSCEYEKMMWECYHLFNDVKSVAVQVALLGRTFNTVQSADSKEA